MKQAWNYALGPPLGCARIVEISSAAQKDVCSHNNLLNSSPNQLWISSPGLPQTFTIELREATPSHINTIGWFCHHAYTTNPQVVRVNVKAKFDDEYCLWAVLRAKPSSGVQLFRVQPLKLGDGHRIQLEILSNFGGDHVYMNCFFMVSSI